MIDGEARPGGGEHEERSPIDQDVVLGRFAQATEEDVAAAVDSRSIVGGDTLAGAGTAVRAADVISDQRFELALMTMEWGRTASKR